MLRILPPATFNFDSSVRLRPWVGVAEGKYVPADLGAMRGVGKWELHDETQAAQKCLVERAAMIGRQDREAAVRFHPLQQVTDLDICVAIVTVFDFGPLAEQCVG